MTRPYAFMVGALVLTSTMTAQSRTIFDQRGVEHLAALSSPGFEAKPSISADLLTLYFASDQTGGAGGLDLWVATRPNPQAPFGAQTNLAVLNGTGRDHTPTTSGDGLLMVFSSNRSGGFGTDDAWTTTRAAPNAPWGPPVHVPELSSSVRDMGFSMTPDGLHIYFTSNRGVFGDFEIFTSSRPDRSSPWGTPTRAVGLNTPWEDKFPTVTGDNLTIYFASNRPGGVDDGTGAPSDDLWVGMRPDPQSPWTLVENVFEINTSAKEYLSSVADDGSELFFVSDAAGGLGSFDLYRVSALRGVTRYGTGTAGEFGVPRLRPVGGEPRVGNTGWGYEITNLTRFAFGLHIHSIQPAPGPFLVDLSTPTLVVFQAPNALNPPHTQPRIVSSPLPNNPALAGFTSYWQAIVAWDLQGQGRLGGIPYAATPALKISFFQ